MPKEVELSFHEEMTVNESLIEIQLFIGESLPVPSVPNSYALLINQSQSKITYSLLYCNDADYIPLLIENNRNIMLKYPKVVANLNRIFFENLSEDASLTTVSPSQLQETIKKKSILKHNEVKRLIVNEILEPTMKCNKGSSVGIENVAKGDVLFSCSFGSCRAVVAFLNDNQCALYHFLSVFDPEGINQFLSLIQDKATHIFIFHKTEAANAEQFKLKAPYIAINLKQYIADHVKLEVVEVKDYRHILCLGQEKKIHLVLNSMGFKLEPFEDANQIFKSESKYESSFTVRRIEQCLLDIIDNTSCEIINDKIFINKQCEISHQLIKDTAQFVFDRSCNNNAFFEKNTNIQNYSVQDCLNIIFRVGLNKEVPKNTEPTKEEINEDNTPLKQCCSMM